jgi:hypothetical protein
MTQDEVKKAKRKWWDQKENAKRRNIEFDFPFEEWLQFWLDSGHWHERGTGKGSYVMSRKNDIGPYHIDNVEIKSQEENLSEGNVGRESTHSPVTCLQCGYVYQDRTFNQHYNGRRCRNKKAPRYQSGRL